MSELALGMACARLGPAAAFIDGPRGQAAACEENRLTRARQVATTGRPALAIAELLDFLQRRPEDVGRVAVVNNEDQIGLGAGFSRRPSRWARGARRLRVSLVASRRGLRARLRGAPVPRLDGVEIRQRPGAGRGRSGPRRLSARPHLRDAHRSAGVSSDA